MQDFRRLRVWSDSLELAARIYELTAAFPRSERFGLTAQMRSAVVSMSSNIAEGAGRSSAADMARFLQMAIGSSSELESQILVAERLGFVGEAREDLAAVNRVRKQLIRLRQRVQGQT